MVGLTDSVNYDFVAACDLKPKVRADLDAQYPGIRTFASATEMLTECPADVVCVSTFPPSHLPLAREAMATRLKGILVEKPLGDSYSAGVEVIKSVRKAGIPMVVPHGLHVAKHSVEILARVHGGEIGELELVEIEYGRWDIINAGIHFYNFFVLLTRSDPIESVIAICDKSTRTYRDGMQVETEAVTYAQTRGGVRLVGQSGDDIKVMGHDKPGSMQFRIIGSKGMIKFWGWQSAYHIRNATYPNGRHFEIKQNPKSGHQLHLENLARMIKNGETDFSGPESSLATLEICDAAYKSSRFGCRVDIPLADFEFPKDNGWLPGEPWSQALGGRNGRRLD